MVCWNAPQGFVAVARPGFGRHTKTTDAKSGVTLGTISGLTVSEGDAIFRPTAAGRQSGYQ